MKLLENLNNLKKTTNTRTKTLADALHRSERTVSRMLSGASDIDITDLQIMASVMGVTLEDIFDGSDITLPRPEVVALENRIKELEAEIEAMSLAETAMRAEITALRDKNITLYAENDKLRITLAHKDEIITLHSTYINLLRKD